MRIKICGIFREDDIDFINEARPDYIGFVFAESPRQISTTLAQFLRFRIADGITPVGVFVNAPIPMITELYKNGVISIAQLHGNEDDSYITQLKKLSVTNIRQTVIQPIKVIKVINKGQGSIVRSSSLKTTRSTLEQKSPAPSNADYFLLDSGSGSGKPFDWKSLEKEKFKKPWFLAGGINSKNIRQAMEYKPFAIDVSSGAETDGIKDRQKILELVRTVKQG